MGESKKKEKEGPRTGLHRAAAGPRGADVAPPVVHEVLRAPGQTLDAETRAFFESRFSRDFSDVRIHTDSRAAESARAVNALAYTVGPHIAFGKGLYTPRTSSGGALLAHELTHVAQHGSAPVPASLRVADPSEPSEVEAEAIGRNASPAPVTTGPVALARATVKIGGTAATVDYGDLVNIPASGYAAAIKARYQSYTGGVLVPVLVAQVAAFTALQQEWVLFGLDVLSENTAQAPQLDRAKAFQRLMDRAPVSKTRGLGTADLAFEREVLVTSGWAEESVTKGLVAPTSGDLSVIDPLLNPPPDPAAPAGGVFDAATFNAELPGLTRAVLNASRQNTANWGGVRPQALPVVQTVGNVIQEQARTFFAPFAETARDNSWLAGWQYSSNISSVTTDPSGSPRPIPKGERLGLIRNRATGVGQDTSRGPSLFSRTNFQSGRDDATLEAVVAAIEADPAMSSLLDDLSRHTGHESVATHEVAISTEVPANKPECEIRWGTIRTLCHELMHSLMHKDFEAASTSSPRFPSGVTFSQALIEGFAEVLGVELFNHLRDAVGGDANLLAKLTQGLSAPCQAPANPVTSGYRDAGANANMIRAQVGEQRFRAAFLSGKVSLIGL
jgi:hypothetical protein